MRDIRRSPLLQRYVRALPSDAERKAAARARMSADRVRGAHTPEWVVQLAQGERVPWLAPRDGGYHATRTGLPKPPPPPGRGAASTARDPAKPDGVPWELLARVREVWAEPSASVWCTSHNQTLGTCPVDAWALGREQDVRNLLDNLAEGNFA